MGHSDKENEELESGQLRVLAALRAAEVDGFYWTALVPDIVNSGREEQGYVSV